MKESLKNQQSFTEMQTTYFQHISHKIKNECVHIVNEFGYTSLTAFQCIHL